MFLSYNVSWCRFVSAIHITGDSYVNKYDRLVLLCNASSDSYPPDELDWFMNGLKVVTDLDEGIRITNSVSLRSRTIWSELVIEHAQMDHSGTYICRTSDELVTNIKVNVLSGKMSGHTENALIELLYNTENKYIIEAEL